MPLRIIPEPEFFEDVEKEFTTINLLKKENEKPTESVPEKIGLRYVKNALDSNVFQSLIYCVLTGKQIIIRGVAEKIVPILNSLRVLFPSAHRPSKIVLSDIYTSPKLAPLLATGIHVAAPQPCENIFRIDVVENNFIVKWTGQLPEKCKCK